MYILARDFTDGNPAKVIFAFALPMLVGNVFQQLYSTVDSIIVGNFVGKNALAAVGSSFSIQFLILSIAIGFTTGMSVVIAQVFGAKDFSKLKITFTTGLIFIVFLSFFLGLLGVVISKPMLMFLDTPPEILSDATTYLALMFLGFPALFLFNMYSAVLRAVGDSKTPLYFLIVASITNIVLDYTFVAIFNMGVAGVAIATLIAQLLSAFLCYLYVNKSVQIFTINREELKFDKDILISVIRYGLPASIQQAMISVSWMAVQGFVNFFGPDTMAAYSVYNKIENFVTMPIMNLAMALSMFAGQNIGAGKEKRATQGVTATLKIQAAFCVSMMFIMPLLAKSLMIMFGLKGEENVMRIGVMAIDLCAYFYIIFAVFQTYNNFHRGVGDTKFAMFATLCMVIIRIPTTYLLIHVFNAGEISIWYGMIAGWATVLVVNAVRYYSGGWRGKAFIQNKSMDIEDILE